MKDGQYNASFWGQLHTSGLRMNSCDSKFLERDFITFAFAIRGLQAHGYTQKRPFGFPSVSRIPTTEPGNAPYF